MRDGKRWRAGVRPGLIGALVVAVLAWWSAPMFPNYTTARLILESTLTIAGTFVVIVCLYGTGLAKPRDPSNRAPVNKWIVAAAVVALTAAVVSECSR